MTREEKDLLLKDLCARLRYGVKVKIYDKEILNYGEGEIGIIDGKEVSEDDYFTINAKTDRWIISIDEFKSYLRPISSMTEEEKKYISDKCGFGKSEPIGGERVLTMPVLAADWLIDFYNEHHLDYRGLIPVGLALEAPKDMYNI